MLHPTLFALLACSQYDLRPTEKDAPGLIDSEPRADTGDSPPDESEPFIPSDSEDSAVACVVTPLAETPGVEPMCGGGIATVTDPWNVTVKWSFRPDYGGYSGSIYAGVVSPPLVSQLTDDNGDGTIDASDQPDILIAWQDQVSGMAVIDNSGALQLQIDDVYYGGQIGALPLADGPVLIGFDFNSRINAWNMDGSLRWQSEPIVDYIGGMPTFAVADFDGDGALEIWTETLRLDAATGATEATLGTSYVVWSGTSAPVDLELDGQIELFYGGGLYEGDGAQRWASSTSGSMEWPVFAQLDADPEGEVIVIGNGSLHARDADGATLFDAPIHFGSAGPPCVGDIDGDGEVEIVAPLQSELTAWELDGTELWSQSIMDSSSAAGCTLADLDNDGRAEVIYADEVAFGIYDGCSGSILYASPDHNSGTLIEVPVVADIDQDGTLEILVVNDDTSAWPGLTVLAHNGSGWPAPSDAYWPAYHFVPDTYSATGEVDALPQSWASTSELRAWPTTPVATADAAVVVGEWCVTGCGATDTLSLAVQVRNDGTSDIPAGTLVEIVASDGAVLTSGALSAEVLPGGLSASLILEVAVAEGLSVRVAVEGDADASDDSVAISTGCF